MEFSFKLYDFIKEIEANRRYIVMWSAFGVPLLILALTLPLYILRKIGLYPYLKPFYSILYGSLLITWIIGFVAMMVLFFTEVSGIRMFMIYALIFITYIFFTIFNYKNLNTVIDEKSKSIKDKAKA